MPTEHMYRPYLTLNEITYMLERIEPNHSVYKKLQIFLFKAGIGANVPAYVSSPKISTSNQIRNDFAQELREQEDTRSYEDKIFDAKCKRQDAFCKWKDNPLLCSTYELELAETYRFENGLMDEDEIAAMNSRMNQI